MMLYEGEIRTVIQRQQSQHLLMPGSSANHAPLKIPGDDALYVILKTAIISDMHLQSFYTIHAGRLKFDEVGERQKERRTGFICDEFQKFSQHLPLTGLELVSLQFNRVLSHKTLTINVQKCRYTQ